MSVAATDRLGAPARYSSFGSTVDLAAPGGDTHHDRDADAVEGASLRVEVDRDDLMPGLFSGRVVLASNGGTPLLEVIAEIAELPPEDVGPVTVLLRVTSRSTVAAITTDAAHDYRYRFDDTLPWGLTT